MSISPFTSTKVLAGLISPNTSPCARAASSQREMSVSITRVRITLSGVGELTAVTIKPEAVEGTDPDSLADLGDLIVAAFRDALEAL